MVVNGVQKAPQFAQLFEPVLPFAFRETASLQSHHIRSAVAHLLIVWADRQIYPRTFLRQLRTACQRAALQADTANPVSGTYPLLIFDRLDQIYPFWYYMSHLTGLLCHPH